MKRLQKNDATSPKNSHQVFNSVILFQKSVFLFIQESSFRLIIFLIKDGFMPFYGALVEMEI